MKKNWKFQERKKIIKAKIFRALKITKPIPLTKQEVDWIKLCKGHYKDKYKTNAKNWIDTLKPMFNEIYGWTAEEYPRDFLQCIFHKLLDIHIKIQRDQSGSNVQIKEIIGAGFEQTYKRDYETPIERCIAELCGQIQNNLVIENGVHRYYL